MSGIAIRAVQSEIAATARSSAFIDGGAELLVGVKQVGAQAQPVSARVDLDAATRKLGAEAGCLGMRERKERTELRTRALEGDVEFRKLRGEALLLREVVLAQPRCADGERELQSGERLHRREHGRGRFEPCVAAGREARRIGARVAERIFLGEPARIERALGMVSRMYVEPAGTRAAARVLVRSADGEIRVERGKIEWQHAGMVIDVQQHAGARGASGANDLFDAGHDLGAAKDHGGDDDERRRLRPQRSDQRFGARGYRRELDAALVAVHAQDEIERIELGIRG